MYIKYIRSHAWATYACRQKLQASCSSLYYTFLAVAIKSKVYEIKIVVHLNENLQTYSQDYDTFNSFTLYELGLCSISGNGMGEICIVTGSHLCCYRYFPQHNIRKGDIIK